MTTPVNFETAKLLKEKGFEKECLFYYDKQGKLPERWESSGSSTDTDVAIYLEEFEANFNSRRLVGVHQIGDVSCSAPTIAQAVMWLYEEHSLWILPIPTVCGYFAWKIIDMQDNPERPIERPPYSDVDGVDYKTPREAYEAAIEYVLTKILG